MHNTKRNPPTREYKPNADGIYTEEPQPDGYITVVTKHYERDGSITSSTWFYSDDSLDSSNVKAGVLELYKFDVNGRKQVSYIPLTEIIRIDVNGPSKEFFEAHKTWETQNEH